jgi:CRISPR-associated protein Csd1
MSWMSMLYQTYENNVHMVGDVKDPLSGVAHMLANAQIEITIDEDGTFQKASPVNKESRKTLIPVTEQSQGRSSGDAPHALCDTLSYIAGDFSMYLFDNELAKKCDRKFLKYISALADWVNSDYSHPKAKAVYNYVSKKCMTSDLIKAGILECNENGKLSDKKVSDNIYEKALVRFIVNGSVSNAANTTWQDATLFDKYIEYYSTVQKGTKDICYLTGRKQTICVNHPNGIISSNYGAKLISANDNSNYTFRGRFITSDEACTVSYEATQKAHNALIWLVARQGYTFGNKDKRTFICWNPKGKDVPALEDSFGLTLEDDTMENSSYTEEIYKKRLMDALNGYKNKLDNNDDIVIIGLDAATTGRLSITYYNELKASDFLNRLQNWYKSCCWYYTKFTADNKPYQTVLTPQTKRIVEYTFGTEHEEKGKQLIKVKDDIMKEQCQRILNCILNAQPVPRDIIHAVTVKASTPLAYSRGNHERVLSTACALIKKYYEDKGAEIKMTLDYSETDRSYLFGRLLAVAEKVERATYSKEDTREPNAIRLQSAFVHHPMYTWAILEKALIPYFQKLNPGSRKFYKDIISNIVTAICENDKTILNKSLGEKYLLGYYLQRAELNTFKNNDENNEED